MRTLLSIGFALSLALLGCSVDTGAAAGGDPALTFPAQPLATVASEEDGLSIEVRTAPAQPPTRGLTTVELVVTDANGKPVDGLDLSMQPWMPQMGHGASTKPTIEAMGGGHYVVSNVALFMPGRWELRTSIGGARNDRATVDVQIP